MQNAECIMQNRLPAHFFPVNANYSTAREFRLAVLMEEMEMATNSFASLSTGAAVPSSTFPDSDSSSIQYPDSSASSSTSPSLEIKAGFDFARHAAR